MIQSNRLSNERFVDSTEITFSRSFFFYSGAEREEKSGREKNERFHVDYLAPRRSSVTFIPYFSAGRVESRDSPFRHFSALTHCFFFFFFFSRREKRVTSLLLRFRDYVINRLAIRFGEISVTWSSVSLRTLTMSAACAHAFTPDHCIHLHSGNFKPGSVDAISIFN